MAEYVKLDIQPHSAYLQRWGQWRDEWFALVSWDVQCVDYRDGYQHRGLIKVVAWLAARHVQPWADTNYGEIPRVGLGEDQRLWPAALPKGRTHSSEMYVGLIDGEKVGPPAGVEWL